MEIEEFGVSGCPEGLVWQIVTTMSAQSSSPSGFLERTRGRAFDLLRLEIRCLSGRLGD
jgi:hypothetical protein